MLFAGLFAVLLAANTSEMMIPEGTILSVVLNETLNTARIQDNDPVLFTLADDTLSALGNAEARTRYLAARGKPALCEADDSDLHRIASQGCCISAASRSGSGPACRPACYSGSTTGAASAGSDIRERSRDP